jgi:hypothetical protein
LTGTPEQPEPKSTQPESAATPEPAPAGAPEQAVTVAPPVPGEAPSLPATLADAPVHVQSETMVCANCHAGLTGEYCAACGQRHEPHVHSVRHFAGEAFESISHADSRLWRTLAYLLFRPGFLTREFFRGKRVSYLPPFRLYLVISVLFFLVIGTPENGSAVIDTGTPAERSAALEAAAEELEGHKIAESLRKRAEEEAAKAKEPKPFEAPKPPGLQRANAVTEFCKEFEGPVPEDNERYAGVQRMCAKIKEDSGADLLRSVVQNIPRAMFVFLPLLALVMKLMYWRPKRYYVEHLLFLIHNHAFVFLVLGLLALAGRVPVVKEYMGWPSLAAWIYMGWYMYRGMRNVYGQSRGRTVAKYFALGFAYTVAAGIVLLLTMLYAAMTYS